MTEFSSFPALSYDAGLGDRFKVSVSFDAGKPDSVYFSDPDRNACKKALGSAFCAYEGPDYEIHPDGADTWFDDDRYYFRLRGPAAEAVQP